MKFGQFPVTSCAGAILAHSVQVGTGRLRKGIVLGPSEISDLVDAKITDVTVAILEPGDVGEDQAAALLAGALVPEPGAVGLRLGAAGTGRCNVFAQGPGVAVIDADAINKANAVHPMVTIATVPDLTRMDTGGMVATVKIISYAVPEDALLQACAHAGKALRLAAPKRKSVTLLETTLGDSAGSSKGAKSVAGRVEALNGGLTHGGACPHSTSKLGHLIANAPGDLILILTASATSDIHDVAPQALVEAGGQVSHFGMPVDPGNLLFLGELNGTPVIGLPGCAKSPALNGADWVLERLMCGLEVTSSDIMNMGVGGLLKEIPTRPQPRKPASP